MFSQTFGGGRRAAILINVFLMVGLAVAAAGILIYITGFTDVRTRIDLTEAKTYTLSQETVRLVENLDQDVEIITIFDATVQPWDREQVLPKVMEYTSDLLSEYRVRSDGRISVERLDPRHDGARVAELFRELGLKNYNMVVVRCGENRRLLGLTSDLAEVDLTQVQFGGGATLVSFLAEEALSSALYQVTQSKPIKLYVVTGHEEVSIDSGAPLEAGLFQSTLVQDNVNVEKLPLFSTRFVPDDADLVVLLNPQQAFVDEEKAALDDYMRRGGRMLVAIDPLGDDSLDPWFERLGVSIERNFICYDQGGMLKGAGPAETYVGNRQPGDYGDHPIIEDLKRSDDICIVINNGGVSAAPGLDSGRYASLLLSHPQAWGDIPLEDSPGGFTLEPRLGETTGQRAYAGVFEPAGEYDGSRLVYVAGVAWTTNLLLSKAPGNSKLLRRVVAWLAGRNKQVVHVPPRTPRVARVELRPEEYDDIFAYTVLYLPAGALFLALMVWFARR